MDKRRLQGSMDAQASEAGSRMKSMSCTKRDGNGSGGDVAVEKKAASGGMQGRGSLRARSVQMRPLNRSKWKSLGRLGRSVSWRMGEENERLLLKAAEGMAGTKA